MLAGIGAALVYGGCIGSALKWFSKERGLASGIMAAGFGGGTALFIPFIASMIKNQGYQAAFIWTGAFQGVVILIVAQFLRHPPARRRRKRPRWRRDRLAWDSTTTPPLRCCGRRSSTCCTRRS